MSKLKAQTSLTVPKAKKRPYQSRIHDELRIDHYHWMRLSDEQKNADHPDKQTQQVIDYLNEENAYKAKMMSPLKDLEEKLYQEIIGRIKQTDMSVPFVDNGYVYSQRYEQGKEYPIHERHPINDKSVKKLLLDVNKLAKAHNYYDLRTYRVSPNNRILSFAEDTVSRRLYTIRFKDLSTNKELKDVIPNTEGLMVWAADNQSVYYTVRDESLRPYKVFKHTLGTSIEEDQEIYHESDPQFICYIYKSKSNRFIIIGSFANQSREFRFLDTGDPEKGFQLFHPREVNHEYHIKHRNDKWLIISNKDQATNFALWETDLHKTQTKHWQKLIEHREEVFLEGIDVFKQFTVLHERILGIPKLRVFPDKAPDYYIDFEDEAYMIFSAINRDMDSHLLRIKYTSLRTPMSTLDIDLNNGNKILLKQQEVVGEFDPSNYQTERFMVPARDGASIPVSMIYRNTFKKNGEAPLLLYAYGSYGHSMDPYFSSSRLSLLDRGFAFAIAHVRGGQELGRPWYDNGKLLHKKNSFYDFIDCAEYLISQKFTNNEMLFAMGGSAGGLLMGAVVNMSPELWGGMIAAVPFVDVVNTMLDDSIPLTTGEYDEWGNPNVKKYYEYIKSYSPYDNVKVQAYPPILVTTGLHDSQVQYWEPAKWVAKLREFKTDNNPILLHCNMETGHSGASGRFRIHKETAMEYAFLIDLAGMEA